MLDNNSLGKNKVSNIAFFDIRSIRLWKTRKNKIQKDHLNVPTTQFENMGGCTHAAPVVPIYEIVGF